MQDLISRQAAIDALENIDCSDGIGISALKCDVVEDAINAINALPSAQPETHDKRAEMHACDLIDRQPSYSYSHEKDQPERKRGKWIAVTEDGDVYKRICSCCGREAFFQNDDPDELYDGGRYELSDFCPHCGADMRKDEQE